MRLYKITEKKKERLDHSSAVLGVETLVNLVAEEYKSDKLRRTARDGGIRLLKEKYAKPSDIKAMNELMKSLLANEHTQDFCNLRFSSNKNSRDEFQYDFTYDMLKAFATYDTLLTSLGKGEITNQLQRQTPTSTYLYYKHHSDRFHLMESNIDLNITCEFKITGTRLDDYCGIDNLYFHSTKIEVSDQILNKKTSGYVDHDSQGTRHFWRGIIEAIISEVLLHQYFAFVKGATIDESMTSWDSKNKRYTKDNVSYIEMEKLQQEPLMLNIQINIKGDSEEISIAGAGTLGKRVFEFTAMDFKIGRHHRRATANLAWNYEPKAIQWSEINERNVYTSYCINQIMTDGWQDLANATNNIYDYLSNDELLCFCIAYANFVKKHQKDLPICFGRLDSVTAMVDGYDPNLLINVKPQDIVLNSLRIDKKVYVVSGPNAEGKSRFLTAIGLNTICTLNGLPCFAREFSVSHHNDLFAHFTASDNVRVGESLYMNEINRSKNIIQNLKGKSMIFYDEPFKGTEPKAGAKQLLDTIECLAATDCLLFVNTHFPEIQQWVEQEGERHANLRPASDDKFRIIEGKAPEGYSLEFANQNGGGKDWMLETLKQNGLLQSS